MQLDVPTLGIEARTRGAHHMRASNSAAALRALHLARSLARPSAAASRHVAAAASAREQPVSAAPVAAAAAASPPPAADAHFYAAAAPSFAALGLDPAVARALAAAGFSRPSAAQAAAAPPLLAGRDVVLAAETGSGKTLAYLAPLAALARADAAAAAARAAASPTGADLDADGARRQSAALILCPNAALCEQVARVAAAAFAAPADPADPARGPVAEAVLVSSRAPPPRELPAFVVTTPAALVALLDGSGPYYGGAWTREGLETWARRVVFDEADLLLGGAYARAIDAIMVELRAGDRARAKARAAAELGIAAEELRALPLKVRREAARGGAAAARAAGYAPAEGAPPRADADLAALEAAGAAPWRRQYAFVAATMPAEGSHTPGAELLRAFPDAEWVRGAALHRPSARVAHAWRRVSSAAERAAALREVLEGDADLAAGRGRALVFALDGAAADATAAALRASALGPRRVLLYHAGVPAAERAAALARVAREEGLVLVATDAAARGLDLPAVSHVVQADFAGNAVDWLHRAGRTGRAGGAGRVTCLVGPAEAPLAEAIADAVAAGRPVEGAFSRNRSFGKKMKKYGAYVPRGEAGVRRE
jgi:superfamily II DNA/RNA helicase